jgi:hypothetical protein
VKRESQPRPKNSTARLLDHFVRARKQRRWDFQAQRLRGLEIDDELELRWLLDWKSRRLLAFQDFVDEIGRAPISAGRNPARRRCDPKATIGP